MPEDVHVGSNKHHMQLSSVIHHQVTPRDGVLSVILEREVQLCGFVRDKLARGGAHANEKPRCAVF
eukprot:6556030-Pyramimonas_sp.AAC.5